MKCNRCDKEMVVSSGLFVIVHRCHSREHKPKYQWYEGMIK